MPYQHPLREEVHILTKQHLIKQVQPFLKLGMNFQQQARISRHKVYIHLILIQVLVSQVGTWALYICNKKQVVFLLMKMVHLDSQKMTLKVHLNSTNLEKNQRLLERKSKDQMKLVQHHFIKHHHGQKEKQPVYLNGQAQLVNIKQLQQKKVKNQYLETF